MVRFLTLIPLLGLGSVVSADAPRIVWGDPLPAGAVARFGIPGKHWNEFVSAGGHTPSGSFRVAVAKGNDVYIWAWQPAPTRPPVHRLAGHQAEVNLVAISPDARHLVSTDKAGEVRVWDLASGDSEVLKKPGPVVTAIAIGPGGRRVAVATGRIVTLQSRATDAQKRVGDHDRDVTALVFSSDGSRLATADLRGRVTVWNQDGTKVADMSWERVAEPKLIPPPLAPPIQKGLGGFVAPIPGVIDFGEGVRKLVFSPDGKRLAAAGGTVVRAWDVAERRVLWQHNRHARIQWGGGLGFGGGSGGILPVDNAPRQIGGVWDVAFSRDGHYLASSGNSGDVRIVHAAHGEDLREPNTTERFTVLESRFTGRAGLAFDPDGKSLTMFEGARKFVRESVVGGRFLGSVAGHGSSVTGLAVSPDGKWLASAGDDNRVRIWRIATGECVAEPRPAHGGGRGTAFSPDGNWLVPGGAYHGFSVFEKLGDLPTFTEPKGYDVIRYRMHAFLPGHDARLFVATQYGASRSIDLFNRKEHGPGIAVSNDPTDLAVSPDGKWIAACFGVSSGRGPKVYSAATGKEAAALEGIEYLLPDVAAFSPDSRLLAAGSLSGVTLWEVATGKKYLHLGKHERKTEVVAFSADGRVLASGGDQDLKLWEVATGRLLGARRADERAVLSLVFLPQSGRLASAGTEGAVLIWDVSKELQDAAPVPKELARGVTAPAETRYWAKRFPIEQRVSGLAFSPDGKTLAAGSQAGRILLFDFQTGLQTATLEGHTSEVRTIQYTPDGMTIVSTGYLFDGKELPVRAWDTKTGKPLWAQGNTGTFPDAIGLSQDGKTMYVMGHDKTPRFHVKTGAVLPSIKATVRYTGSMAVSVDGKYLAVGGIDGNVVLWDLRANREVRKWRATETERNNFVQALTFAPDSKTAVTTASDGRVRAWDVGTGEKRREWQLDGGASAAVFSPKGGLIAFAGDPIQSSHGRSVTIWDPATGAERLRLVGHGPRVAWSPDGRWLATADVEPSKKDSFVLIWEIQLLLGR